MTYWTYMLVINLGFEIWDLRSAFKISRLPVFPQAAKISQGLSLTNFQPSATP